MVSSLLFAGVHLLNTGLQGAPDLSQLIGAGLIALPLAALRLRSGSLLSPILFHAAFDYYAFISGFTASGSLTGIAQWVLTGTLFVWGVRVLLQLRRAEQTTVEV